MFQRKKLPPIKSLIAQGTEISGDICFAEGLRIDGVVRGNLSAAAGHASILVISETAQVQGEIRADHVIVNGQVVGPIHAADLLELQPKAQVQGDLTYRALEMHQGASVAGLLCPLNEEEKPLLSLAANNG